VEPEKPEIVEEFTEEQQEVLKSIRMSRIIVPILLGIGVVIYMLVQQYDSEEFAKISWTTHTLFWVVMALVMVVVRHLAYSLRLYILSQKEFSYKKCIELVFIWEFSSAVSPTSLGGSAVAFFILAQEKLSTAKTATIVLYTIVVDTLFFIGSFPILFLIFGTNIIRPQMKGLQDIDGWGYTFIFAYLLMATYGTIVYIGLFQKPNQIKRFLIGFTKIRFLRKHRQKAVELGNDMVAASEELKKQNRRFHIGAFLSTAVAWSCRFLLLNCLIIAFIPSVSLAFMEQFALYSRLQTMFVIIAFSPTPGGAGFVEILFTGFLTDYVRDQTSGLVISTIWRLMAYYAYLLAGVIVIPNWIRTILNERKKQRLSQE